MKLRSILLVLSLLVILSASTGGYLYFSSLREAAYKEAERQGAARLKIIRKNLSAYLTENIKPVRTLAGMDALARALTEADNLPLAAANAILDHFKKTLDVDVCYLMNREGATVASSNRDAPDSFVGKNFSFRPYFKQAIAGKPATYLALGTASAKRGAYYSQPVTGADPTRPSGIVVIKASIELIEKELGTALDEIVLVADPHGVIFISNRQPWRYHLLWKYNRDEITQIKNSRQFGAGPWQWTGLESRGNYIVDRSGIEYQIHVAALDTNYPGWNVIHLRSLKAIAKTVSDPLIRITGPVVLLLCMLIGLAVFFLYRKASDEIIQRRSAQAALRESENRHRALYHRTPAMLHSVDINRQLVSVSDYWVEKLGYQRQEVIGRKLTDFLTPESVAHAEKNVFPEFFTVGYCQDVPYRFVKKNGETIDVLLSAIGDRDAGGNITRSLAVSIDVTERNRAEAALKQAKEKLSRYSHDLERQVRKQTREITSILEFTPAVVYIKDRQGRYILVNSRYEQLFGVRNNDVRGKTDTDILPAAVADQFHAADLKVLGENRACQIEVHIQQSDGVHTYLAAAFPIYDEAGAVTGVGGILNDFTAVNKARDQLRRLSAGIMASQEKERSALARELHDELGQVLTALRMDTVWMHSHLKQSDPEAARRALTMCRLIDKNIEDVRGMAFRLRPGVLDDLGLVDALEWITSDFERRTEITCVFEHDPVPELDETVSTAAYRVCQEALTNVARHALASRVQVLLKAEKNHLTLVVIDDGCGFDTGQAAEREGLGMAGMHERATLVGGTLEVHSQPGKGTRLYFKVPLPVKPQK
jgi:PAS domain S-box-containing protein